MLPRNAGPRRPSQSKKHIAVSRKHCRARGLRLSALRQSKSMMGLFAPARRKRLFGSLMNL